MKDETDELVEMVEIAGRIHDEDSVVEESRELWNWYQSDEDVDVELRIGSRADLIQILKRIGESEKWTVRFCDTTETPEYHVSLSVIYHPPEPDPQGTVFFEDL